MKKLSVGYINWPGNPYIEVIKQISIFCEQYENVTIEGKPIALSTLLRGEKTNDLADIDVVFSNNQLITNSLASYGFGNFPNNSIILYKTIKFCYYDTRFMEICEFNETWEDYTETLKVVINKENKLGWYFYMEDPLMVFFHFFLDCFINSKEDLNEAAFHEAVNKFYSMFSYPGLYSNLYYGDSSDQLFEIENRSLMGTVSNYELFKLLNGSNEFLNYKKVTVQPQLNQCLRDTVTNYEKILFNDYSIKKEELFNELIRILHNKHLNERLISKVGVVPVANLSNYKDDFKKTFYLSPNVIKRVFTDHEKNIEQYSSIFSHFNFHQAVSLSNELKESLLRYMYKQPADKQLSLLMWSVFEQKLHSIIK